ncbi:hypothetical protein FD763_25465 [Klebsiella quasipneumoniae]|nr:hypothetical protein [Klebsiella quasipneumoniae]
MKKMNRTLRRCCLSGLISLSLFAPGEPAEFGFMNPFTWLFIALLSVDAVRELMGLSSIMGMW